jgi:hypothetical protein
MVTFNNAGRFGNWFFETATAIAYSLRHGLDFSMPTGNGKDQFYHPVYCKHLINPEYNPSLEEVRLWESSHAYQPLPFDESWRDKNIIIEGYRQSAKYFDEYKNEILYLLDFPYEKKDNTVAVHVRRGDYLLLKMKHPPVEKSWYENAMSKFGTNFKFRFYSDDIDWCIKEFGGRSDCEFSVGNSVEFDAADGACCEHQIISASTFGWAMAWLNRNPNKIVYLPRAWFVDGWDNIEVKDIVPLSWYKL